MGDVTFELNGWPFLTPESPATDGPRTQWRGEPGWWKLPANIGDTIQHVAADGSYLTPSWFASPRFTLQGTMKADSRPELRAYWEAFKASLPVRTPGPLVANEDGLIRYRMVRVDQPAVEPEWITDRLLVFSVQLVAADGRLFDGPGPASPASGFADARLPITEGGLRVPGGAVLRTNLWSDPVPTGTALANGLARWAASGAAPLPQATIDGQGWVRFDAANDNTDPTVARASNWGVNGLSVAPNTTYTLSFEGEWSGTITPAPVRYVYNAAGTILVNGAVGSLTKDVASGRWFSTFTTPANSATLVLVLRNDSTAVTAGSWWRFRRTALIAEASMSGYFDGGTPASGGRSYQWTGTPNASASQELSGGLTVPFRIGATVTRSSLTVPVHGNAAPSVTAVIRAVNEPLTKPMIKDQDGNTMAFDLTLDVGQSLELDWDAKTIMLNGTASRRSSLLGDWLPLKSSDMVWSFSADGASTTNAATLTVTWRDAWI